MTSRLPRCSSSATPVGDIATIVDTSVADVRRRALRIIGRLQAGNRRRATPPAPDTTLLTAPPPKRALSTGHTRRSDIRRQHPRWTRITASTTPRATCVRPPNGSTGRCGATASSPRSRRRSDACTRRSSRSRPPAPRCPAATPPGRNEPLEDLVFVLRRAAAACDAARARAAARMPYSSMWGPVGDPGRRPCSPLRRRDCASRRRMAGRVGRATDRCGARLGGPLSERRRSGSPSEHVRSWRRPRQAAPGREAPRSRPPRGRCGVLADCPLAVAPPLKKGVPAPRWVRPPPSSSTCPCARQAERAAVRLRGAPLHGSG